MRFSFVATLPAAADKRVVLQNWKLIGAAVKVDCALGFYFDSLVASGMLQGPPRPLWTPRGVSAELLCRFFRALADPECEPLLADQAVMLRGYRMASLRFELAALEVTYELRGLLLPWSVKEELRRVIRASMVVPIHRAPTRRAVGSLPSRARAGAQLEWCLRGPPTSVRRRGLLRTEEQRVYPPSEEVHAPVSGARWASRLTEPLANVRAKAVAAALRGGTPVAGGAGDRESLAAASSPPAMSRLAAGKRPPPSPPPGADVVRKRRRRAKGGVVAPVVRRVAFPYAGVDGDPAYLAVAEGDKVTAVEDAGEFAGYSWCVLLPTGLHGLVPTSYLRDVVALPPPPPPPPPPLEDDAGH
jgi:hypothetical protein